MSSIQSTTRKIYSLATNVRDLIIINGYSCHLSRVSFDSLRTRHHPHHSHTKGVATTAQVPSNIPTKEEVLSPILGTTNRVRGPEHIIPSPAAEPKEPIIKLSKSGNIYNTKEENISYIPIESNQIHGLYDEALQ